TSGPSVVDHASRRLWPTDDRDDALRRMRNGPHGRVALREELGAKQQVLRRIAADAEFGEDDQVSPVCVARLLDERLDAPDVAGDVSDREVVLGQGDAHHAASPGAGECLRALRMAHWALTPPPQLRMVRSSSRATRCRSRMRSWTSIRCCCARRVTSSHARSPSWSSRIRLRISSRLKPRSRPRVMKRRRSTSCSEYDRYPL